MPSKRKRKKSSIKDTNELITNYIKSENNNDDKADKSEEKLDKTTKDRRHVSIGGGLGIYVTKSNISLSRKFLRVNANGSIISKHNQTELSVFTPKTQLIILYQTSPAAYAFLKAQAKKNTYNNYVYNISTHFKPSFNDNIKIFFQQIRSILNDWHDEIKRSVTLPYSYFITKWMKQSNKIKEHDIDIRRDMMTAWFKVNINPRPSPKEIQKKKKQDKLKHFSERFNDLDSSGMDNNNNINNNINSSRRIINFASSSDNERSNEPSNDIDLIGNDEERTESDSDIKRSNNIPPNIHESEIENARDNEELFNDSFEDDFDFEKISKELDSVIPSKNDKELNEINERYQDLKSQGDDDVIDGMRQDSYDILDHSDDEKREEEEEKQTLQKSTQKKNSRKKDKQKRKGSKSFPVNNSKKRKRNNSNNNNNGNNDGNEIVFNEGMYAGPYVRCYACEYANYINYACSRINYYA